MINLLVIAHAEIAMGYIGCVKHILGKKTGNLNIITVNKSDSLEDSIKKAKEGLKALTGGKVLILSDLYGATPYNIARKLVKPGEVELITGLNIPMLIRAVCYSNQDLKTCITKALEGAREGIMIINKDTNDD